MVKVKLGAYAGVVDDGQGCQDRSSHRGGQVCLGAGEPEKERVCALAMVTRGSLVTTDTFWGVEGINSRLGWIDAHTGGEEVGSTGAGHLVDVLGAERWEVTGAGVGSRSCLCARVCVCVFCFKMRESRTCLNEL